MLRLVTTVFTVLLINGVQKFWPGNVDVETNTAAGPDQNWILSLRRNCRPILREATKAECGLWFQELPLSRTQTATKLMSATFQ